MRQPMGTEFYLFGDQTQCFDAGLCQLLQIKDIPVLSALFERVTHAIRMQIGQLPVIQRGNFPRFSSLHELLARYRETPDTNPALESMFVCLHQLALFISHVGQGRYSYPDPSTSHLVGLCTGLLAAAAISMARTVMELLPVAVEAVLIAFYTGLRALEMRNALGEHSRANTPWSAIVGIQEEAATAALKEFSQINNLPLCSRPYISMVNVNSVTITGPPAILDLLLTSHPFLSIKPVKVSVYAPYHASHLYTTADVHAILARSPKEILAYKPQIPLVSSVTGKRITSPTYGDVLKVVIQEILIQPLRWDNILEGCVTVCKANNNQDCIVFPIAGNAQSLALALSQDDKVKVRKMPSNSTQISQDILTTGRREQSKIAIIGYSGRFPDAASAEQFWDLLRKGLDVHRDVPEDRWDLKTHFDPTGKKKNTSTIRHGCWIESPGLFDARFFHMSPREADNTDPGQRLALTTAYEAMEMAGFIPDRTPSTQRNRVGMFYGMTSDDWREVNSAQDIDTYFVPGGNRAFTPGRINYYFKFSGPSLSIDSACSSSLAAIHTACTSLWKGDCDTAIAGGTNILTNPDNHAGLDRGHFLSRTGNCNTFDDAANGYCRADGVATVILKRLEDAIADKDPIQAVILGACTNHSAEAVSMTRPHAGAQAYIFSKLLTESNIDPHSVSYIEMHGTGTQAGDAVEMKSVLDVFSPTNRKRGPEQSLHLGSAKANVGHAEASSGVISLVKVLLMMEKNEIPPHPGIKTKLNRNFPTDLRERNIHIAMKPTLWHRKSGDKRKVFLNNFSAAGGNTALLIEDAPVLSQTPRKEEDIHSTHLRKEEDIRSTHLIAISGKSIASLKNNIQALADFIQNNQDLSIPALSYTTTARRMHHNHRIIISGSSLKKIKVELEAILSRALTSIIRAVPAKPPTVSFVFTGQGALYAGMGKELYENFSQYRSDIHYFDTICLGLGFPSILPLLTGSFSDTSKDEISPMVAQLGITCMQLALTRLWSSWGVKPAVVVGHSLGEYAALNAAGVLSISDTIYLVGKRAQLLEERCTEGSHGMLAVRASIATLRDRSLPLPQSLEIACINGPEDIVLSGINQDIESFQKRLSEQGIKCVKPKLPFAFHSAQVEPILDAFESVVSGVIFHKPSIPVISPLLAKVITDSGWFGPEYLSQACRGTVDFVGGLKAAQEEKFKGIHMWVEIGPHPICSGMVKSTLHEVTTFPSLRRNEDTWQVLTRSLAGLHLAGVEINWDEYHRDFPTCHNVIRLPAYCWDYKNHWIQYTNNWCLTKGDPVQSAASKLSTPSVQRIITEHIDPHKSSIVIESDLSEPTLNAAIQGHKVNSTALCPSSLYADIAFTLGDYLLAQSGGDRNKTAIDVSSMVVDKPLIYDSQPKTKKFLRVSANADWVSRVAQLQFYTVTAEGKKLTDHAKCIVKFIDNNTWQKKWKKNDYLIKGRIDQLRSGVNDGQSHKIKRGMVYKLFSALVEYDQKYRGIDEVILDSAALESTALVTFKTTENDGNFYFSPYWIDSLGHLSGFTMNANDAIDSKTQVFINHGWDSMRFTTKFSARKTYQTYVKMQNVGGTMFSGDVYILEADIIVGVFGGVRFQEVPRKILDTVLPPITNTFLPPMTDTFLPPKTNVVGARGNPVSTAVARVGIQETDVSVQQASVATKQNTKEPGIVAKALAIVAEEIGLNVKELGLDSRFSDFGVDSLLSLTILGRFREELNKDLESSFFLHNPTITDLIHFFSGDHQSWSDSSESDSALRFTPEPGSEEEEGEEEEEKEEETEAGVLGNIHRTIAEEVGVSIEEINGNLRLAEVGMDSLLALTVRGRLQEEFGIDLPSGVFLGDATLDKIVESLGIIPEPPSIPSLKTTTVSTQLTLRNPVPKATSILLQGNVNTAKKILFLFPDGSGSATSYAAIPKLGDDIAVVGLNCPFMKTPENMPPSLKVLTPLFLDEIHRRQPKGPYIFGGWSAGGVCAYDAAQVLIDYGEKVDRLIFLDSPCPIGLGKIPPRFYEFLNAKGMFGPGKPPSWLLPHFLAFIDALDEYKAVPFAMDKAPKTYMIWAEDGVCKYPDDPRPERCPEDPKEMYWLLENRTDFGHNGWDALLGETNLVIDTLANANHFTMIKDDAARRLAEFIVRAMTY